MLYNIHSAKYSRINKNNRVIYIYFRYYLKNVIFLKYFDYIFQANPELLGILLDAMISTKSAFLMKGGYLYILTSHLSVKFSVRNIDLFSLFRI